MFSGGCFLQPIAKTKTLGAATRQGSGNDKGVRDSYGRAKYTCDSQPAGCTPRPQHEPTGTTKPQVYLSELKIWDEMDWEEENDRPVVGFRDDGGLSGRVRDIRIISRQQYEALKVEELTRKKSGKKSGKKRKADDRKPAAKRSSKRNKK